MSRLPDVTVIVPVYNKGQLLPALLESLAGQSTDGVTFDVVAVDDGSTDESGDLLDRFSEEHPWLRVIHQPNSGWPGQPRNRGIASSESRYVFFADADDYFGSEALQRMVVAADDFGSDVLLPKFAEEKDRDGATGLFAQSLADVPIAMRFKTLSPHKLFRRAFLDEHDLRFVEYRAPLEDGMLLARAYLLAERVSMAADYSYYYRVEGGETSISIWRRDPWEQRRSVGTILSTVRELCEDREVADDVCLDIYRRKGIRYIRPGRVARYDSDDREEHVLAAADLADSCMPPELEQRLSLRLRLRSRLVRQRDPEASYAFAIAELAGPPPVRVDGHALVLDTGPGRATIDVTSEVGLTSRATHVRAKANAIIVRTRLITRGLQLRSTDDHLLLTARGADGSNETLAHFTSSEAKRPDRLRLRAKVPAPTFERAFALPDPVTLAIDLRAEDGTTILSCEVEPAVDLAQVLVEHRAAKEEAARLAAEKAAAAAEEAAAHPLRTRMRALARKSLAHAPGPLRQLARRARARQRRAPLAQPTDGRPSA